METENVPDRSRNIFMHVTSTPDNLVNHYEANHKATRYDGNIPLATYRQNHRKNHRRQAPSL